MATKRRITFSLDLGIYRVMRRKSDATGRSLSGLVNDALRAELLGAEARQPVQRRSTHKSKRT